MARANFGIPKRKGEVSDNQGLVVKREKEKVRYDRRAIGAKPPVVPDTTH
jgi:hypothetical protein